MLETVNRRFTKIPLLHGFCMVIEKLESDRSKCWFPEVYFFDKSGQPFITVTQEYVGKLFEELVNLDDLNHAYPQLPCVLCSVSKHPYQLVIRPGRTLNIMWKGQPGGSRLSEVTIANENAIQIVKAMRELG